MANEYQMRLKDMHAAEKIKEVTDKLSHEIENLKQQLEALRVEKVSVLFLQWLNGTGERRGTPR